MKRSSCSCRHRRFERGVIDAQIERPSAGDLPGTGYPAAFQHAIGALGRSVQMRCDVVDTEYDHRIDGGGGFSDRLAESSSRCANEDRSTNRMEMTQPPP